MTDTTHTTDLSRIFKAYDIRATYPDKINEQAAWKIGVAFGRFISGQVEQQGRDGLELPDTVCVSRDMRPHSPSLAESLIEGIRASGMTAIDLGMCDTSFIYFAINHLKVAGGVQVTASHNPINYNGFKMSGREAKPIGETTGLTDIRHIAETLGHRGSIPATGNYEQRDLWSEYREHVLQFLTPLKRKTRVFIDASNGMAGRLVPAVFEGVENLEIIPINFEIGGEFAHEPNPLVAENMIPTQEGVKQHKADLGACFDGDADRCMLVDDKGQIIGCDHLTALLAHHFVALDNTNPGTHGDSTVVFDLRSSKVVEETLDKLGAKPCRSRVGHVFMKANLRETGAVFGGELSGHFYFRDNFFADSGAIAFASVLSVMNANPGKSLSDLIAPYRKYPQSGEINFEVEDKAAVLAELKKKYKGQAKIDELDGVTVDAFKEHGWWFNVRPSNTEPLLRFNAEARDQACLEKMLAEVKPMLGTEAHGH